MPIYGKGDTDPGGEPSLEERTVCPGSLAREAWPETAPGRFREGSSRGLTDSDCVDPLLSECPLVSQRRPILTM